LHRYPLARVENYPFGIELLLAGSGFYNERVIRRTRDIAATVVHVLKKGEQMKDKLDTHKSYMTTYRIYKDRERELCVPLAVAVSYQNGDRGKHGGVIRGYVRAASKTSHRNKSNASTGSVPVSRQPIGCCGKHEGSR